MIAALVGAQFGSEGKGLIAGHIAKEYDVHVRVGAANAGHTVYTQTGVDDDYAMGARPKFHEKHVMQQIPCAAYANPRATLVIGPGALVSPEIFSEEVDLWRKWRSRQGHGWMRILVDPRAHVILDKHIERESITDLAKRIGSTSATASEGIGSATAARVMREAGCCTVRDWVQSSGCPPEVHLVDTPQWVNDAPTPVLLEGTQGTGLSLTTGFFPYTTSRNTTAAGLAADAGASPRGIERVILVARSYPIRVAGNSGPFYPDSDEIDWQQISVNPENERTTVTKKVRRVATFSMRQLVDAVQINGATEIALTFADYLDPWLHGRTAVEDLRSADRTHDLICAIEDVTRVPVAFVGTGPHSVIDRRVEIARHKPLIGS